MPQPHQQQPDLLTRVAVLGKAPDARRNAPATLDESARTVGVILTTEAPVTVYDWDYGRVDEVLLMSGVELPANGQIPMLDSHNRWSVESQIGSMRDFSVQGDALYAEAHFSSTAEEAFTLVREGHLTDVSVGYRVREHIFVPEKTTHTIDGRTFAGPIKIVTRWEVKEGSFTPIGADKNAKARSASDGQSNSEENPMSKQTVDPADQGRAETTSNAPVTAPPQPAPAGSIPLAPEPARAEVPPATPAANAPAGPSAEAIRAEAADIIAVGRMHNCMELAEEALRSGTTLTAFNAVVLAHIAARSEKYAPGYMPHVEIGRTDGEKFRAAVSDALCLRAGSPFAPKEIAPGAEQFRGYSLMELARESLRRGNIAIPSDPVSMIGRAFTETSSDFPNVLADTANKSLIAGAEEAAETYEVWTGETTANNFMIQTGVNLNAFTTLEVVPDGHEYTAGTLADFGIRYAVATYGKLFGITRQTIINDNVNAFTQIPAAMGRAAMRARGNAVYSLLIDNPQMADGNALFSAAHNNLAASGGKIGVDAYTEAVTAMGTHKGDQDEVLNIMPRFLLAPVSRTAEARILLQSQFIGTQASPTQINPWQGDVTPVTEGRLDFAAGNPWFLLGPKGMTVNVAYLFGNKGIRLEQRQGFTIDGVQFKVSSDFGTYVADWRPMYKNPGA